MHIELTSLCDAATDTFGKLNILGAFDALVVRELPCVHPQCALAIRIRFTRIEAGEHRVHIRFVNEDGKNVLPDMKAKLQVAFRGDEPTVATNLVLNMQRLRFEAAGQYSVDIAIDGREEMSLPLFVRQRRGRQAASN